MPSYMLSIRLPPPMEKSFRAAAKRAGLTLSDWMKATCVREAANEEETQRPLDPHGPEPVAVPIKQRKKREKVIVVEEPQGISGTRHGKLAKANIPQDPSQPISFERIYTGETQVWNGITMYEYGKGRWTKEPPPKK